MWKIHYSREHGEVLYFRQKCFVFQSTPCSLWRRCQFSFGSFSILSFRHLSGLMVLKCSVIIKLSMLFVISICNRFRFMCWDFTDTEKLYVIRALRSGLFSDSSGSLIDFKVFRSLSKCIFCQKRGKLK